jgi:hypothetical protein
MWIGFVFIVQVYVSAATETNVLPTEGGTHRGRNLLFS